MDTPPSQKGGQPFKWPTGEELKTAARAFSPLQRTLVVFFGALLVVCAALFFWVLNKYFLVEVPGRGGMLTEGLIGAPRFVNPVLAFSDADRDVTMLVYSGLMRATPAGALVPDLAESWFVSKDGLTYTFTLKKDLAWHDREPVTSDDIIFTVSKVNDPALKSPKRASWEGVSAEKVDERTIRFTLPKPYAPFLENATLGILPEHIWKDIDSEQFTFSTWNTKPVGSGPYQIEKIKYDDSGIPILYELSSFGSFALGSPYVGEIRLRFYANEDNLLQALAKGEIGSVNAITPERAEELKKSGLRVETYTLPRVFGVFFNQNKNTVLVDRDVRDALSGAIDREKIVRDVLRGYATTVEGPLPPGALGFSNTARGNEIPGAFTGIDTAKKLLEKSGWSLDLKKNMLTKKTKKGIQHLELSLSTSDAPEMKAAATIIRENWEALGAKVSVHIFSAGDLNQSVIRPRKYDALLFGEIIGRESDPFAFWHSSQRNDPGLNIALYANISVDKLLEDARVSSERSVRSTLYKKFEQEVAVDIPAAFIYSPDFIYVVPNELEGLNANVIAVPSERFIDVHRWYTETEKVWRVFVKNIDSK